MLVLKKRRETGQLIIWSWILIFLARIFGLMVVSEDDVRLNDLVFSETTYVSGE